MTEEHPICRRRSWTSGPRRRVRRSVGQRDKQVQHSGVELTDHEAPLCRTDDTLEAMVEDPYLRWVAQDGEGQATR